MKRNLLILFAILYVQFGFGQENIPNETMRKAKINCDSFLSSYFGDQIFNSHFVCNLKSSFTNCKTENGTEIFHFDEAFAYTPEFYDLTYCIVVDSTEIFQFRISGDKNGHFSFPTTDYWTNKFQGYKKLLEGKYEISYKKASIIAEKNGFKLSKVRLELQFDEKHFWSVEPLKLQPNEMTKTIRIDVQSGVVTENKITLINIE